MLTAPVASIAHAQSLDVAPECYDAIVEGKIEKQTPSVFSDSNDGSITMVWPWLLSLNVRQVVVGSIPTGPLQVLSMQHTSFRKGLGSRRWWLRRNSLGGFNLLRFAEAEGLPRCAVGREAAQALIRPGPNQTLDDLLRDGERAYRSQP
jgi:hypothetical protein